MDDTQYRTLGERLVKIESCLNNLQNGFENHLQAHNKTSNRWFALAMVLAASILGLVGKVSGLY